MKTYCIQVNSILFKRSPINGPFTMLLIRIYEFRNTLKCVLLLLFYDEQSLEFFLSFYRTFRNIDEVLFIVNSGISSYQAS